MKKATDKQFKKLWVPLIAILYLYFEIRISGLAI